MIPFVIAIAVIVAGLIAAAVALLVWIGRINRHAEQTQADLNLEALKISEARQRLHDEAADMSHFTKWAIEMYTPDPMPESEPAPDVDDTIQG